jgi:hypothetical protein
MPPIPEPAVARKAEIVELDLVEPLSAASRAMPMAWSQHRARTAAAPMP